MSKDATFIHTIDNTKESVFQNDMIARMQAKGWLLGNSDQYDCKTALYTSDVLDFVKHTQPKEWTKFCKNFPVDSEQHFISHLVTQLKKADANAVDKELRSFGTLGVLRHGLKIRNARFSLCQFMPEHKLNPDTLARFEQNRCRIVPELVYSPYATAEHMALTGKKAKAWRIDLVLFVNGLPVATLELKSEFKQAIENAKRQYQKTRLPNDPETKKPEPLLTFKRGALVHFAVSQFEVYMATKLAGDDTFFLPFNRGTAEGGAGNEIPANQNEYATEYLWNEVLLPSNLLNILGRFVHLQIEEKEDWEGRKSKKETLIFPRYHQWDVVSRLINAAKQEGTGHKYLVQHSAGSGKSNSIAWTAHQLSTLHDDEGNKQFDSIIVITDRTVLDDQLQDTIYQFEHADGVVGRINKKEGDGSKSEKLATALENAQPIIIVTIQTFPHVLEAIENSVSLQQRRYAVIADEAHSSQTGSTAKRLKEVLMVEGEAKDAELAANNPELSSEDRLNASLAARKHNSNLNYYAFTATPKAKTLELFGRLPYSDLPASKNGSKKNLPQAFHVYSMRQAIEEGFILDVLKNYTNYKVAYQLAQKIEAADEEVDSKKAKVKLSRWVRLHEYNIAQKVKVIIDHFKEHVMGLLGGQAKAMVVTSSRKEAVRYKLAFDKYLAEHSATNKQSAIAVMVAFSGEVEFNQDDPDSTALLDQKFTEKGMNPNLKGRDMRKAFDSDDYQIMLVANKFQTGFDQPKLCAMYVDKPLGGVECVQTLSRLNRTYPGKAESGTFVLDFVNEPDEILSAFQPYYQTAELADVSDPDKLYDLEEKLRASGIFTWNEVEQFCDAFLTQKKSNAAVSNICKPAVDRWQKRYSSAVDAYIQSKEMFERTKKTKDAVLIANAENSFKECKQEKDRLEIFKKDLGSFTRFYEFMSQIVDYDNMELEKLSLYARYLRPLLREKVIEEDDIDLDNVVMSHYRLSKIRQQHIKLKEDEEGNELEPSDDVGTAKAKDKKEEFMSQIVAKLNELFITDGLTDGDMISFLYSKTSKVAENETVMKQIKNNTAEQAFLGDFPQAFDNAVMDSDEAHQEMMMQYLSNPLIAEGLKRLAFDMLKSR
ncbi:type I restriction endonuclease subunit R [Parashewanella spongiae]|uniref:Type I restriction endonuclease subunit R n=1 Tax=Parashewanella spongiae TaxID=342950 RepID=A0A3A6U564_9GAMM|nr:DEAD/DEAH box helicase family protein [Parashewanella spongiae]MCL1076920.1 DEAD/DEAH box helicase family protein [Parashewanella spongiae]RJY19170.1 type I restriction endonuclease subunit R [Parashewanella spongiae]USN27177.1 DEAD/DEAH box helicase family protein [synthetic construct]